MAAGGRPSCAERTPGYDSSAVILAVLALIPCSFIVSCLLTWWLRGVGLRRRHLDGHGSPGHVKSGLRGVPNIGGIAVFAAIALPVLGGLAVAFAVPDAWWTRIAPWLALHLPGMRSMAPMALVLLAALLTLHLMGLRDDRRPLGPWLKLAVQCAVAAVLVILFPREVRLLTVLDGVPVLGVLQPSAVATILWLVVMTNAMNMMDNTDGLAAGVGAIAATLFLVAACLIGQWFVAAMLATLVGALLGFLVFNFPPATIFMGDGGSLVIGFLLGFLTVRTTYYNEPLASTIADSAGTVGSGVAATGTGDVIAAGLGGGWYAVFMPLIVLAVPLYDFASVVILRLGQGRNPLVGDEQHFSHRLVKRGLSRTAAVVTIYGYTLATGLGGVYLAWLDAWQAILVGVQTLVILGVLAIHEHAAGARGARPGGGAASSWGPVPPAAADPESAPPPPGPRSGG